MVNVISKICWLLIELLSRQKRGGLLFLSRNISGFEHMTRNKAKRSTPPKRWLSQEVHEADLSHEGFDIYLLRFCAYKDLAEECDALFFIFILCVSPFFLATAKSSSLSLFFH